MKPSDPGQSDNLALSEKRILALFDAALDGVVGMNAKGIVIAWNRQAEKIFGWRREEAMGEPLADLIIPPETRAAHQQGLERYLETGIGPVLNNRVEVVGTDRNGREFPVELSIIPIRENNEPVFFGFLRDLSHQKMMESRAERNSARDKLLFELAQMAAETGDFDELLQRSLTIISTFTNSACGHIYLPDPPASPTFVKGTDIWHLSSDKYQPVREIATARKLRIGEGLPGRIWKSGRPEWISNLARDDNFFRAKEFEQFGLNSGFGFPVMQGDQLLAIFEFFATDYRQPDSGDESTILRISSHLGRVFERQLALEQSRMLSRELAHRVGNLMAIVSAVFQRSVTHASTVPELAQKFRGRLQAMKTAQAGLSSSNWEGTTFRELADRMLAPYSSGEKVSYELRGEDIALNSSMTMSLSLMLHELAVNAAKYGALSDPSGRLVVEWDAIDFEGRNMLTVHWRESGGPAVKEPDQSGFGSDLINSLIVTGLGGEIKRKYDRSGFTAQVKIPL